MALYRACQAWALLESRDFVLPDDVKRLSGPVLVHRLILSPAARLRGTTVAEIGEVILGSAAGRRSPDEVTLFKSVGVAIEDVVAADLVYRAAVAEKR